MEKYKEQIVWNTNGLLREYNFTNKTIEQIKNEFIHDVEELDNARAISFTNENGEKIAYFNRVNGEKWFKGEKELKKETKLNLIDKMYYGTDNMSHRDATEAIEYLEKNGYIELKNTPKYIYFKTVTIDGETKKLYFVSAVELNTAKSHAFKFDNEQELDGYEQEEVEG